MLAVPVPPPLSTTSGYSVPCTRNRIGSPSAANSATRSAWAASNVRMNSRPMILRFSSGSVTPASAVEEPLARVDGDEPHAGRGDVVLLDLLPLARAQQAVIDEDADQLVADRLVHESRGDRRVDAARETADDATRADLGADAIDLLGDDVAAVPVGRDAGRLVQEVLQHRLPVRRVLDLGVPLNPVQLAGVAREGGDRRRVARGEHLEPVWRAHDRVAVPHPRGLLVGLPLEEHALGPRAMDLRRPVLASAGLRDLAAELLRHDLEPVTDAQRRHPELQDAGIEIGRARLVHARRAPAQHDAGRVLRGQLGGRDRVRHDLAVDPGLAHPPGDELRVLGAEVDDEDGMLLRGVRDRVGVGAAHESIPASTSSASAASSRSRTQRGTENSKKNDSSGTMPPSAMNRKRPNDQRVSRHSSEVAEQVDHVQPAVHDQDRRREVHGRDQSRAAGGRGIRRDRRARCRRRSRSGTPS